MKKFTHNYWYCLLLLIVFSCAITNTTFSKTQASKEQFQSMASVSTTTLLPTHWFSTFFNALIGDKNINEEESNINNSIQLTTQVEVLITLQERYELATDCKTEKKLQQEIRTTRTAILNQIKEEATYKSFSTSMPLANGCPEIQVIELLGIPGFIETEELVICGAADTLAYIIFIEEPGNISGTQMTANFLPGMQYAGFELTHYGGPTTIANLNPSPNQPNFLLEGITECVYELI